MMSLDVFPRTLSRWLDVSGMWRWMWSTFHPVGSFICVFCFGTMSVSWMFLTVWQRFFSAQGVCLDSKGTKRVGVSDWKWWVGHGARLAWKNNLWIHPAILIQRFMLSRFENPASSKKNLKRVNCKKSGYCHFQSFSPISSSHVWRQGRDSKLAPAVPAEAPSMAAPEATEAPEVPAEVPSAQEAEVIEELGRVGFDSCRGSWWVKSQNWWLENNSQTPEECEVNVFFAPSSLIVAQE